REKLWVDLGGSEDLGKLQVKILDTPELCAIILELASK
ncbi:hypothetical protein HKBW3S33_02292, partial [Candidatus Hakubella thermalkaliphila]